MNTCDTVTNKMSQYMFSETINLMESSNVCDVWSTWQIPKWNPQWHLKWPSNTNNAISAQIHKVQLQTKCINICFLRQGIKLNYQIYVICRIYNSKISPHTSNVSFTFPFAGITQQTWLKPSTNLFKDIIFHINT